MNGRLRVMHLHDDMRLGGSQRVAVDLANHQVEAGMDVVVAAEPHGELWPSLARGVRRLETPPHGRLAEKVGFVRWLRRAVRAERIDLVHAHQRQVALLANIALLGVAGAVVVEHVHNSFVPSTGARLLSFRSRHLVACGSSVRHMLVEDFGRPHTRISLVRNSVVDPAGPDDLVLPSSTGTPPKVVGVGRLDEQKDPAFFVEVVRHLRANGIAATAEWVGAGPLGRAIEEDLSRRPVPGLVLSGATSDVGSRIRDADLLLLTSRHEGLPLVVLEAMALGRGVVCRDVGSCRDVVEDGVNGVVYAPSAEPAEVAEIISAAFSGGHLERWGRNSRQRFVMSDGVTGMVRQLSSIYQHALEGRGEMARAQSVAGRP